MSDPQEMTGAAVALVKTLLAQRLVRGRIATTRPDFYFACEPGEARARPGGTEVRVRTWRHWSEARVYHDAATGEEMGWTIHRHADPPTRGEMSRETALAAAAAAIDIPPDAVVESFYHFDYTPRHRAARLEWRHVHDGLRVHGDWLHVVLHPATGRVIEHFRKWRQVRLE